MKTTPLACLLGTSFLAASAAQATVLIDVNVAGMGAGPAPATWSNSGSVPGDFTLVNDPGQPTPEIEIVGGFAGIHLNREVLSGAAAQNAYQGPITPAGLTAPNASRTIEVWGHNPGQTNAEEMMVGWGRRGGPAGTNMSFGWTNQGDFGAIGHWGGPDAPWGAGGSATPPIGGSSFHHLVYTYDGADTRLYSDGLLVYTEATGALDTHDGFSFVVGGQIHQNALNQVTVNGAGGASGGNFTGLINTVRIHDVALSDQEIMAQFAMGPARIPEPSVFSLFGIAVVGVLLRRHRR